MEANVPRRESNTPVVMIVEDEPRLRDLMMRAVRDMGFDTIEARSGEAALKQMENDPADIILLDLNLPGVSGLEVFEQVVSKWSRTQVIILTGFGDLDTAKKAIRLGVVDFLTKPCPLGDLEQSLDRARKRLIKNEPPQVRPMLLDDAPDSPAATLETIERNHILAALHRHDGNRAATAAELGISLRTLYYRLAEYQKQGHVK